MHRKKKLVNGLLILMSAFTQIQESLADLFSSQNTHYAFKEARLSVEIQQAYADLFKRTVKLCQDAAHIVMKKMLDGTLKLDQKKLDDIKQKMKAIEFELGNKLDVLLQEMNTQV